MTPDRLDEIETVFRRHPTSPNIIDLGHELIAELRQRGLARLEAQLRPDDVRAPEPPQPPEATSERSDPPEAAKEVLP